MTKTWLLYRMSILWGVLISLGSLGTCIVASLENVKWATLDGQARFLLTLMVFINWSNAMVGLITNTAKKIEKGQLPFDPDGTDLIKRSQVTEVQQTTVSSNEIKPVNPISH